MVKLNEYGKVAQECWKDIENHFENVGVDEFIVMPNHIHGIVLLADENVATVGNRHACSLQCEQRQYQKLPVIIGSYKSAVSRKINESQHEFTFQWQKSFYDHIIRNEISLAKIRQYIISNPINWLEDRNNIPNLYY